MAKIVSVFAKPHDVNFNNMSTINTGSFEHLGPGMQKPYVFT